MKLVPETSPVLREVCVPVVDIYVEVVPFFDIMIKLMRLYFGVGLAAPQIGLRTRFFVADIPGLPFDQVFVNPKLNGRSLETEEAMEGCLSFPKKIASVRRNQRVSAQWTTVFGYTKFVELSGTAARIFQHELDHLDGICIFPKT